MTLLIHRLRSLRRFNLIGARVYAVGVICGSILLVSPTTTVAATPCAKTRAQQDRWVRRSVDLLIRSARAAYQEETAERAYARVLGGISNAMMQCRLTDDVNFTNRYPQFVEYVRVLSLDRQNDHELGFEVS